MLFTLHCTSGVVPRTDKIEVIYLGSIYDDLYKEKPVSAGLPKLPGIKIAHSVTEPVFMEYYLFRMGLYELLKELGIDYVIGDTLVQDRELFGIRRSMGYAITNYRGVRFAVVSSEDSLTIDDQVQLALLKERSDIIWIIDAKTQDLKPSMINFYIRDRTLTDTSMAPIEVELDTALSRKIMEFRNRIENGLNIRQYTGGRVDEHLFSTIAERHGINVIFYPEGLFQTMAETDSMTLRELMDCVAFQMKFKEIEMDRAEISETRQNKALLQWGTIMEENIVLLPDEIAGKHIFDFYYTKE
jgi:hypothetical protein